MSNIEKLLDVMRALRDPENGCEWDVAQDFASIAPYTIEEAYEVADAIERNDIDELRDELGDLLLQVVFHAQIATDEGHFDFDDVAEAIASKMVRRHPHVFGSDAERAAGPVAGSWERIKSEEREGKNDDDSAMADVAQALPALKRAQKLGKRASGVGFDWDGYDGVRAKVDEELGEFEDVAGSRDEARIEEEFGDLLFAVVNLARHVDVDAEKALRAANRKFERRFRSMESAIRSAGGRLERMSLAELEREWRSAKRRLEAS